VRPFEKASIPGAHAPARTILFHFLSSLLTPSATDAGIMLKGRRNEPIMNVTMKTSSKSSQRIST